MSLRRLVFVLSMVLAFSFTLSPVLAAPEDSGTITVIGTVAPSAASISQSLEAVPAVGELPQHSVVTYTIKYSSNNVAAVPIQLQAEWGLGTIEGATEPTAHVVEYVIGSASDGYGATAPVVDTVNRRITWNIPSVLGGGAEHQVTFQLRTTESYSGALPVTWPVTSSVVSPVGVPDESVTLTYKFDPSLVPTPTPTPAPSSSNDSDSSDDSDDAEIKAPEQPMPEAQYSAIRIPSVGAISARVAVETTVPVGLEIRYGLTPMTLNFSQVQRADSRIQEFVLLNLSPGTPYYFQVNTLDSVPKYTDIFTFTTSLQGLNRVNPPLTNFSVTQDGSHLYSSSGSSGFENAIRPLVVVRNSVLDFNLRVPDSETIDNVELFIRSMGVLAASTQPINLDDLQSTTTKLTQVGEDSFVGKLRMPRSVGEYELMNRLEDIHGNITEESLGTVWVISPFAVRDAKTDRPVENARVFLSVFNEKTQLFETLSNVTTSLNNPGFTDAQGEILMNLFPGRYEAEVSMPGYESQTVVFDIRSGTTTGFPQISLEPKPSFWGGKVESLAGVLIHAVSHQSESLDVLARSRRMYGLVLVVSAIVFILGSGLSAAIFWFPALHPDAWLSSGKDTPLRAVFGWFVFFAWQLIRICGEFFVLFCLLFGVLFWYHQGAERGGLILLITSLVIALWSIDLIFLKTHEHESEEEIHSKR